MSFEYCYSDDIRMYNTFNQYQLLHWAEQQGRMHDLKMAFFADNFTHGRNLSDNAVLAEVGEAEQYWVNQGIQGVPTVVVNRRHLVSGAKGVESFTRILEQMNRT